MANNGAVLVLGSTGIIGTDTVSACVRRGFDVLGVSRGTRRPNGGSFPAGCEHARADVRDPDALRAVVAGRTFDAVIDFTSFTDRDVARTLSTLQGRCAQYLFVSSATIYSGAGQGRRIDEHSPWLSTGWDYALAKVRAEGRVRSMCQDLGLEHTIARPYITYSSQRIPLSVWEPKDILVRLRDGRAIPVGPDILDATTTITSSADVAKAFALLVCNPSALGQDFIVASDHPTTWRAVLGAAADAVGGRVVESRCSAQTLARAFPAIEGKVSDRLMDRAFNVQKLRAAVGDIEFSAPTGPEFRDAVHRVLTSLDRSEGVGFQGRADRFVAEVNGYRAFEALVADHRRALATFGLPGTTRYVVGRHRSATRGLRLLRQAWGRGLRRRATSMDNPYG